MKTIYQSIFVVGLLAVSSKNVADVFHYNNLISGDRAMGLGGAFCGVADDASGIYYNPAGLAFAISNDISGSANVLYKRSVVYKKAVGDEDFIETSNGSAPAFFGGLQKLDHISEGMAFAFAIWSPDNELKEQNDNISAGKIITDGATGNQAEIKRYHRTVNYRASTNHYGVAMAKRIASNFAVGFGASYFAVDELIQSYQDVIITPVGSTTDTLTALNYRRKISAYGIEPIFGLQWAVTPKVTVGLSYKHPILLKQKAESVVEQTQVTTSGASAILTGRIAEDGESDSPFGKWPSQLRLGTALFASTRMLVTFDAVRISAASGDKKYEFQREAVTNFAGGVEYYILATLPLRVGFFTNNDSRPDVKAGKTDQSDHIDYIGGSLFLAWVQQNSQISGGVMLQQGTGKAQKLAGNTLTQDVEATSTTFALSASHNF